MDPLGSAHILVELLNRFVFSMRPLHTNTFNCSFPPYHLPNVNVLPIKTTASHIPIFSLCVVSFLQRLGCSSVHCQSFNPQVTSTYHFVKLNGEPTSAEALKDEVHTGLFTTMIFEPSQVLIPWCADQPTYYIFIADTRSNLDSLQMSPRDARKTNM